MNKINFNQTGGFPLSVNIADAMQTAYSLFNSLGNLAGNFAIISGCTITGSSVSDGVVYINGEIIEFKGGTESTNVFIKEETENRVFEDGSNKPVIIKRYATFGSSTPDKTYQWAGFKRIFPTTEIQSFKNNFEKRLKALETKKSPIPIGLIAIWNKPSTEPIPEGWQECTDLRGRFPLGWDPNDTDFNELGREDGEKEHTLTIQEMPEHNHQQGSEALYNIYGGGDNINKWEMTLRPNGLQSVIKANTSSVGGNEPHNNMPPYRIIRYIEFVGFN